MLMHWLDPAISIGIYLYSYINTNKIIKDFLILLEKIFAFFSLYKEQLNIMFKLLLV